MNKFILSFLFQILAIYGFSQNFWTAQDQQDLSFLLPQIQARNASYFNLNVLELKEHLSTAPFKENGVMSEVLVKLPLPDGSFEFFMVFEDPIMQAGLAAKYPEFKTYIFQSLENPLHYGRADITHKGFHAMIFSDESSIFIDPYSANSSSSYVVYYKKDFYSDKILPSCLSTDNEELISDDGDNTLNISKQEFQQKTTKVASGSTLRTYRLAVSATAEYTQFHGGTIADGLAAIVTSVNRVNGVYERDFTIRLVLVDNNDLIIYTNASSDPFSDPSNPSLLLSQNQSSIDNTIGNSNYDVGHVVGRSGSGLASFRSVCRSNKAQGTTGVSNPIGDPFDIDYLAHEIGHQFGGSHTYNGSSGSCGGNISVNSAYEPGSGTTIMAYAGICAPQNVQNFSDDHFHVRSFDQIVSYTTNSQGDDCPVKTSTGNNIPQISIISENNLTIPFSTPFELEASASDADGNALTYCWEQFDLGPSSSPNTPSGNAPLFRSFSPTTNPIRTFPQISDIVNNTQTLGEILPDYARGMNFRVTVRDNQAGGGAVDYKDIDIDVSGSAGPFLVSEPNTNTTWSAGSTYTVAWDVAGTDQAPINCSAVDIYLSIDGGYTYPILLEAGLLNNGSAFVEAPFAITNDARIKVKCSDNIFFDISDQDFSIEFDCNSVNVGLSIVQDLSNTTWCLGSTGTLSLVANSDELVISSYRWFFNGQPIAGANSATLSIPNVQNANAGSYSCIVSNDCNSVNSSTVTVTVTDNLIVPSITQQGNQLVSSLVSGNQWYYNGAILPGETGQVLTIGAPGAYYVASVAGACSSNSASILTSIKNLEEMANIQVWPNPSSNLLHIQVSDYSGKIEFELLDVLGNVLRAKQEINAEAILDLSNYSKGVYFLKFSSNEYQSVVKLLRD